MSKHITTSPEFFKQLHDSAQTDQWVILKMGASWCPSCVGIQKDFDKLAIAANSDLVMFVSGDVDELGDVERKWPVSAMPTFMVFYNQERQTDKTFTVEGGSVSGLRKLVNKVNAISTHRAAVAKTHTQT